MRDDERHPGDAADIEGLTHGVENGCGFGAQVRGVNRRRRCQRLRQGKDLFGRGGIGREIGEAGAEAEGAVIERLLQLAAHGFNFDTRRRAVEPVHVVIAERRVADQRGDIHRRPGIVDCCNIVREGWINEGVRRTKKVHRIGRLAAQPHRSGADAAVPYDHRGDTLGKLRQHLRIVNDAAVVMGMNVDEAGSKREPLGVNKFGRLEMK
jgi:hypothetical protein